MHGKGAVCEVWWEVFHTLSSSSSSGGSSSSVMGARPSLVGGDPETVLVGGGWPVPREWDESRDTIERDVTLMFESMRFDRPN